MQQQLISKESSEKRMYYKRMRRIKWWAWFLTKCHENKCQRNSRRQSAWIAEAFLKLSPLFTLQSSGFLSLREGPGSEASGERTPPTVTRTRGLPQLYYQLDSVWQRAQTSIKLEWDRATMDSEVWLGLGNDQTLEMAMWPVVLYKILSDVTSCNHFKSSKCHISL